MPILKPMAFGMQFSTNWMKIQEREGYEPSCIIHLWSFRSVLRVLGIVLLVLSVAILTWGLRSGETQNQSTELSPAESGSARPGRIDRQFHYPKLRTPPSLEARLLELSWPKSLRLGDSGTIRLTVGLPASGPVGARLGRLFMMLITWSYNPTWICQV